MMSRRGSTKARIGKSVRRPRSQIAGAVTTLKDIAKVAGVSAQTVSCVVNDTGSVSEEVRERIRMIAARMGYMPNKSAQAMRTGRSRTLGLVVSDMRNPFIPALARAVEQAAAEAGYALLLVDTHGPKTDAAERISTLKMHAVDGVLATEYSPPIGQLGVPTVIIGSPEKGIDSIRSDDESGGTLVADHLLQKGHRTIGLVTSPIGGGCVPIRRAALIDRFGLKGTIAWEVYTPPSETITADVRAMLRREDVTAIACSTDIIAIGVLRALKECGREVPGDVSVIGFDDIPWASIVTPALTTIVQPVVGLGKGAIDLLVARIEQRDRRARHLKLAVSLIERDTVGPPRSAVRLAPLSHEAEPVTSP
jgi:LacI family transcriptional regulator